MGDPDQITVTVETEIASVEAAAWDACAGGGVAPEPFVAHAFLDALEKSGSATPETGWHPRHMVMRDGGERIIACAPCYAKTHSQGEYVFDHGWADAFERAGGRYYPKLQVCVPFTPVTGQRLLVRPGADAEKRRLLLAQAGVELCGRLEASSLHLTFATYAEWAALGEIGFLQRTDQQFHWRNEAYATFDEFLATLSSRKRKLIRRERRDARGSGIEMAWLTGADLREHHWDEFFAFYLDTGSRKWGHPYLTRDFFSLVSQAMAEKILLIMCKKDGRAIAGALNFIGEDTLYGRYWGALEDHPFLHFEACYYQAMDYAIAHGLATVEAGAQGGHKLARGYLPVMTRSAHYIANPSLRDAVEHYLKEERKHVKMEARLLAEHGPYRQDGDSGKGA